jgi:transketolase
MGGIVNGMALHGGVIPYGATFLVFSDYMRPSIRLSSLMGCHSIFIFTHDSIGLGEDGPTHQPVEHLASLRAMPGLTVMRPADANETAACWRLAIERNGPCALVLTRQSVPTLADTEAVREGALRGGYTVAGGELAKPDLLLIATGSEVSVAIKTCEMLAEKGVRSRVLSLPSWEVFEEQPQEYKDQVLPPELKARLSIEAGAGLGWHKYVGDEGKVISLDHFGASAPGEVVMREFGFTPEKVAEEALALVARARRKENNSHE